MSVILDTDHCIAILRGQLDANRFVSATAPLFVTVITVCELTYGACKSAKSDENLAQVDRLLAGVTVLPFDTSAAQRCGKIKDGLRRAGAPLAEPDLQIASIAIEEGMPLATHNLRHFDRVPGLQLVDWLV